MTDDKGARALVVLAPRQRGDGQRSKGRQTDLDEKGIAKNAREDQLRARKAQQEHQKMAELYRQVVLKEAKPEVATGLQIQGLGKKKDTDVVTH